MLKKQEVYEVPYGYRAKIGLVVVDNAASTIRWHMDSDGDNLLELSDETVSLNLATYPELSRRLQETEIGAPG